MRRAVGASILGTSQDQPLPVLDPEIPYVMYGATNDNSASTRNVQFHASDHDRLSPETVLIQVYDEAQRQWSDTVVSLDDFQHRAEALCD